MAEIVTAFWNDGTNFSKDLRKIIHLVLMNGKVALFVVGAFGDLG